MLKQVLGQSKKLQKKVVPLSNMFSNRLDDFVNSFNKKDIICCHQIKNATSFQLSDTRRNKVIDHFKIEKRASEKNKVAGHSKIEEEVTKKNKVTSYSEIKEKIEDVNKDMSKVSFFY